MFGPVLTVLRYRDDDDAVAIANNSQYGLCGAVWGTDVDRAVAVARRIRTGQISINGCSPRRRAVRRVQAERNRPRGRRTRWVCSLHGAEGNRSSRVTAALAGLRVVEIGERHRGPVLHEAARRPRRRRDKIEPPSGDPLRRWGPFPGGDPDPNRSGLFEYLNAGKHGATMDLDADGSAASN